MFGVSPQQWLTICQQVEYVCRHRYLFGMEWFSLKILVFMSGLSAIDRQYDEQESMAVIKSPSLEKLRCHFCHRLTSPLPRLSGHVNLTLNHFTFLVKAPRFWWLDNKYGLRSLVILSNISTKCRSWPVEVCVALFIRYSIINNLGSICCE